MHCTCRTTKMIFDFVLTESRHGFDKLHQIFVSIRNNLMILLSLLSGLGRTNRRTRSTNRTYPGFNSKCFASTCQSGHRTTCRQRCQSSRSSAVGLTTSRSNRSHPLHSRFRIREPISFAYSRNRMFDVQRTGKQTEKMIISISKRKM